MAYSAAIRTCLQKQNGEEANFPRELTPVGLTFTCSAQGWCPTHLHYRVDNSFSLTIQF